MSVDVMTLSREMCWIDLQVNRRTIEIEALVVQNDPLGFNLLMGGDVIKALPLQASYHMRCNSTLH